jgi:hypothetical protein
MISLCLASLSQAVSLLYTLLQRRIQWAFALRLSKPDKLLLLLSVGLIPVCDGHRQYIYTYFISTYNLSSLDMASL